ncbi:hypothetical protein [Spiroplasma kunkelii]|nr:hypothetical protein [Spiroplasma kunkelii]
MEKRYLLISKSLYTGIDTELFYTFEEAKVTAKNKCFREKTIIDL